MGAEFVTFDNAVNAMPLLCRVLYEGAAYMAVLKNFLCLFYYLRIIRRVDYRAEITGNQELLQLKWNCSLLSPHLAIADGISSSNFMRVSTGQLAVSSLPEGVSSTLNFHKSIGTDGTRTFNLLHRKRAPFHI